jgi:hypothetical protein
MKKNTEFIIQLDKTKGNIVEISKKGSVQAAKKIYDSILDGEKSAAQVAEMFKFVEETSKQLKDLVDDNGTNSFVDLVRDEIIRNADDKKSFTTKNGTKFEIFESAGKYDFSTCGDPVWNRLNAEAEKIDIKKKERESFLKSLKKMTKIENIIDPDTSELFENVELYPPIKNSTSTYKQTMING